MIHSRSARAQAPLVVMNVTGISDSLLESELFGHVKGSFTGAYRDKVGLFEVARNGTVILDDVAEMSLRSQSLLLRFLETGQIHPLGSDRPRAAIDVRVVAVTNRSLVDQIASNNFREDLYFRINVIHIHIPPLRERREDIQTLAHHFLRAAAERYDVQPVELEPDALDSLINYAWPGNVRELKSVIERAVVHAENQTIKRHDLPAALFNTPLNDLPSTATGRSPIADTLFERMVKSGESFWSVVYEPFMLRDLTREDVRSLIRRGLEQTRGNYRLMAQLFNMPQADYKRFVSFLRRHDAALSPKSADHVANPLRATLHERRRTS
jgi:transcriptional regulator with GAF, ATPase, and Fis domain